MDKPLALQLHEHIVEHRASFEICTEDTCAENARLRRAYRELGEEPKRRVKLVVEAPEPVEEIELTAPIEEPTPFRPVRRKPSPAKPRAMQRKSRRFLGRK